MIYRYLFCFFVLLAGANIIVKGQSIPPAKRICGKWESIDKRLIISVYIDKNNYRAKILWFSNTDGKPLDYWRDVKNPDPKLRNRRLLGMSILSGLKYNKASNSWEGGQVYDSTHGRTWNASARIDKKGLLHVRGYWHFKFIGRTLRFYRVLK
jgi:uncharacterized protein (DUF2147 family)